MKNYIYCETTAKGEQTYYLMADGKRYFLFRQAFRKSNKIIFEQGVCLFDLKKIRKNSSHSVRRTAEKLPPYIRYIEQEYGLCLMENTKRKKDGWKSSKKYIKNDYIDCGVA